MDQNSTYPVFRVTRSRSRMNGRQLISSQSFRRRLRLRKLVTCSAVAMDWWVSVLTVIILFGTHQPASLNCFLIPTPDIVHDYVHQHGASGYDGALLEYDYTTRVLKKMDQIHDNFITKMMISPYVETKINCESNAVVDRISRLPDDMIISILSLLSLKEAASTSVLSTRWSDLWRHTPNLIFLDAHLRRYEHKYKKCVNSVVESHKALSLKEFSISFPVNYSNRNTVLKWLEFAFSRRVEVLELNLFGRRFALFGRFMRKSSVLSALKSSNLRSLCLKCLEVSGNEIELVLRNCPLLERLIIGHAVLTSDLEVCGGALKHLDIHYCISGKSIKGYAPNLTCLKIDFCPPFIRDSVGHEYNPSSLNILSAPSPFCLPSSPLTTLEFTLHCPPKDFEQGFPQMPTLRELVVTYLECGHGISPITSLIRAFPHLEEFEIKCFSRKKHCTRGLEQKGIKAVNRHLSSSLHGLMLTMVIIWN